MKKKNTLKILTLILLSLAMLSVFCVSISAEENISNEASAAEENIFDSIYREIEENADKILSALSFSASLIIAFAYKRGLMPAVKNTANSIANSVNKLKEENDKGITALDSTAKEISDKLQNTEDRLSELILSLEKIENELKETEEEKKNSADVKSIMSAQVDMLYEIFMTSSLPQYRKDDVGARISEMKRALGTKENE